MMSARVCVCLLSPWLVALLKISFEAPSFVGSIHGELSRRQHIDLTMMLRGRF